MFQTKMLSTSLKRLRKMSSDEDSKSHLAVLFVFVCA